MQYEFADLSLDTGRRQLSRGDEQIKLTKLSYKVLEALVAAAPNMLTHDELVEKVWGPGRVISPENISQRVAMLRQSLGDSTETPIYLETVYGQGFRLVPDVVAKDSLRGDQFSNAPASIQRSLSWMIGAVVLVALAVWVGYSINQSSPEESNIPGEAIADQPLTIAVLPFVNLSNDADQEYFVDGLTEEVLNSLVKIDGLLITGRTSSFAYKNRNLDLRQIGQELDVDYLLEGSVRKSGDQIRITAQLIDTENGAHVLSSAFDRDLADTFAVQYEISQQVAAALKVSLIHRDDQYNSALETLDAIAVEQLLSARAQIAEYSAVPVRQALDKLDLLNNQYPNTPEIMGLIARGQMIYGSVGAIGESDENPKYGKLARDTLALDPTNLDALYTLAVTLDDSAMYRIRAKRLYQRMIQSHPGRGENYSRMLMYLGITYAPCGEIRAFLDTVPAGVIDAEEFETYDACMRQPWKSIYTDDLYSSMLTIVEENPNQRFLASLYIQQLQMGAMAAARETDQLIDYRAGGWWVSYAAGYKSLYGQPSDRPVDSFIDYFVDINYGSYDRAALFLVHQTSRTEDLEPLKDFLDDLPDFPIEIANQYSAVGLMLLQHRAGRVEDSMQTARKLMQVMEEYLTQSPESYRHYSLASNHLIAAIYANDFDEAEQILSSGFADGHPHWSDDIGVIRTVLSPWTQHPLVTEYMDRIETDRERALQKFGLQ